MKEKQIVKLNETQLRNVVKESVKRILNENMSMNIEDCLIKFKEAADNVLSCFDGFFDDDYFGGENDIYYSSMKRLAVQVSEQVELMLANVYGNHPKELNESKYTFHCYIDGVGSYSTSVDDLDLLKPYIQKSKYWDVTKGMNTSDPNNLVAWGGEGGYWSNFLEKPDWAKEGVHWNKPNEEIKQMVLSKKKN